MLDNGPPSPGTPCEGLSLSNDADGGLSDQSSEGNRYMEPRSTACQDATVGFQSSTSSKKCKNSARTDQYGCSDSPDHVQLRETMHCNEITSDEATEESTSHNFAQSVETESDIDLETDQTDRITLPNRTQSTDGPNLTKSILQSHRTRNKQAVFSHVEIRNSKKADKENESARFASQRDSLDPGNTSPTPSSNPHYPWCLSGTTLSIDIRKAERLPIAVGYSAFRVVDGQLFQILTLSQGNVESHSAKGPMRDSAASIYSTKTRKRSNRAWSSAKRGPLSPIEKRKLVALRDNGYTWNEIATRFPQKKKSTLQSIYYGQMKSTRGRITLAHEDSRCRRSACNSRHSILSGESESTSISDGAQSKPISHPRYSFRPRRGPRF